MKYSFNWLKELSGTKSTPEKVVESLTMHSFEIEGLEKMGKEFEGVVVGKILEIKKHPNADKLQLVKVDIEGKKLDIVCGAKNIKVGQKVPVATVGTKLPNGLEIKEAEIRGEKSSGMLCAKDELGIGDNHSGIFILNEKAKIGTSLAEYLSLNDWVLEMKVLPDRGHDALSHVGVAREIAVLENRRFDYDFDGLVLSKKKSKKLNIEIKDKKLCKRYIGVVLENIDIKESPEWMQARLKASGIRSINNVVDATNYVMLELGQPLHAFDFEKIKNNKNQASMVIRRAKKDEEIVLLDESEIKLEESNLLITNGEIPLALAGIMGGKNSGINENTRTVVLEAASFNATNIRKTRTTLGLRTDSSDRFEKDLDPNLSEKAMVRLIEILEHIANGKLEGVLDIYSEKIKDWKIKLDVTYIESLLGEKIPEKDILRILNLLGVKTKKGKQIECMIPTYRLDIRTQEDLIEDIGRIWGYEKISPRPMIAEILPAKINKQVFFERKVQDILIGLGFDEVYNYSFYSEDDLEKVGLSAGKDNHLWLVNPMNPDQAFIQISMVPNILKNMRDNLRYFSEFGIFEIGRSYAMKNQQIVEERVLAMSKVLTQDKNSETFFNLKGDVEDLLEVLGTRKVEFVEAEKNGNFAFLGRIARVIVNGKSVGFITEINQQVLQKYKIGKRIVLAEIKLEDLQNATVSLTRYKQVNKFPSVSRDLSIIVPKNVKYIEIESLIKKANPDLIDGVILFDRFEAKNSMAIRIEISAKDRTLESSEIDELMAKIIAGLEKDLRVEIRK